MPRTSPINPKLPDHNTIPLELTNENSRISRDDLEELFDELGLEKGEFNGKFHPLTVDEKYFAPLDWVHVIEGHGAYTGSTALFKGEKFLMPTINFFYGDKERYYGDMPIKSESETHELASALAAKLKPRIEAIGGHLFFHEYIDGIHDNNRVNKHAIQILIPFQYVYDNAATFYQWWEHMELDLFKTSLTYNNQATPSP